MLLNRGTVEQAAFRPKAENCMCNEKMEVKQGFTAGFPALRCGSLTISLSLFDRNTPKVARCRLQLKF